MQPSLIPELLERAVACVGRLYREGYKFKKAGVLLNGLVPASPMTIRMQDDENWQRSRRVMKAVDEINAKFGADTIRYGAAGFEQKWKTKLEKRSPRYTTNWGEILNVA
ncbi:MAG TPA: DUF4113 domain-containing protein [Pyrinomonadaceae bacterium]|nr:DUF4113 domain-containing protein [Pyrinomonadaceae bacterium]